MPAPVITAFEAGEQFSSISSLTLLLGVSWGTCSLPLRELDFRRETLESTGLYIGIEDNPEEAFDQYCRLDAASRRRIHLPRMVYSKTVHGFSIGLSLGGPVGNLSSAIEEGMLDASRALLRRFTQSAAQQVVTFMADAAQDATSYVSSFGQVGTSGGFFNMYDAGALHGVNGNDTLSLNIADIGGMNFCLLQLGGGCIAGAGINILLIGRFRSLSSAIGTDLLDTVLAIGGMAHLLNAVEFTGCLLSYFTEVFRNAYCYTIIGDASAGIILPGVDIKIVAS